MTDQDSTRFEIKTDAANYLFEIVSDDVGQTPVVTMTMPAGETYGNARFTGAMVNTVIGTLLGSKDLLPEQRNTLMRFADRVAANALDNILDGVTPQSKVFTHDGYRYHLTKPPSIRFEQEDDPSAGAGYITGDLAVEFWEKICSEADVPEDLATFFQTD